MTILNELGYESSQQSSICNCATLQHDFNLPLWSHSQTHSTEGTVPRLTFDNGYQRAMLMIHKGMTAASLMKKIFPKYDSDLASTTKGSSTW